MYSCERVLRNQSSGSRHSRGRWINLTMDHVHNHMIQLITIARDLHDIKQRNENTSSWDYATAGHVRSLVRKQTIQMSHCGIYIAGIHSTNFTNNWYQKSHGPVGSRFIQWKRSLATNNTFETSMYFTSCGYLI